MDGPHGIGENFPILVSSVCKWNVAEVFAGAGIGLWFDDAVFAWLERNFLIADDGGNAHFGGVEKKEFLSSKLSFASIQGDDVKTIGVSGTLAHE